MLGVYRTLADKIFSIDAIIIDIYRKRLSHSISRISNEKHLVVKKYDKTYSDFNVQEGDKQHVAERTAVEKKKSLVNGLVISVHI